MSNYYKWHLRDETDNHCSACRSRNGKTKSGEEWDLIGTPPVHRHCGCSLELVYSDDETEEDVVPDGNGTHDHEPPTDPEPDDETPEYPPGTPGGATPPRPPPPKCGRCGGPHLTKFCPDKRR